MSLSLSLHPAAERGYFDHRWLQTHHSFSFAAWHRPDRMGFGALRVLNDDVIQPGQGFGTHRHEHMEILTVLLEGRLEHRDSTGATEVLEPGMIQHMSAGTGISHSEYNASSSEPLRLLQIWVYPDRRDLAPSYQTAPTDWLEPAEKLSQIAAPQGAPLGLHQDGTLWLGSLKPGAACEHRLVSSDRRVFVFVAEGQVEANGVALARADGLAVSGTGALELLAAKASQVVLLDLPSLGRD